MFSYLPMPFRILETAKFAFKAIKKPAKDRRLRSIYNVSPFHTTEVFVQNALRAGTDGSIPDAHVKTWPDL